MLFFVVVFFSSFKQTSSKRTPIHARKFGSWTLFSASLIQLLLTAEFYMLFTTYYITKLKNNIIQPLLLYYETDKNIMASFKTGIDCLLQFKSPIKLKVLFFFFLFFDVFNKENLSSASNTCICDTYTCLTLSRNKMCAREIRDTADKGENQLFLIKLLRQVMPQNKIISSQSQLFS